MLPRERDDVKDGCAARLLFMPFAGAVIAMLAISLTLIIFFAAYFIFAAFFFVAI